MPLYRVGRPVVRPKTTYQLLDTARRHKTWFGLIERTRLWPGRVDVCFMVVRSPKSLPLSGVQIRALSAASKSGGFGHKLRDPRTWMSTIREARGRFTWIVRRASKK